jgi:hypothetical protein
MLTTMILQGSVCSSLLGPRRLLPQETHYILHKVGAVTIRDGPSVVTNSARNDSINARLVGLHACPPRSTPTVAHT